jgi:hypothetical protein
MSHVSPLVNVTQAIKYGGKEKWAHFAAETSSKRQRTITAKNKGGQTVKEKIIVQRMS